MGTGTEREWKLRGGGEWKSARWGRERGQGGDGDGGGDPPTNTGWERGRSEVSGGDGNGDEGNGNEGRVRDGEIEAKKRKKPQNSCRRQGENGGDFGGKRKICRKERVGPVASNSDDLESNKEAGGSTRYSGLK